jgi:hypothetical protein
MKHGLPPCEKIRDTSVLKYLDLRDPSNGSVETSKRGKGKSMLCLLNYAPRHDNVGEGAVV